MAATPVNNMNQNSTDAGLWTWDGVGQSSSTPLVQYNTLVGASANTVANIAPGTSGWVYTSNGPTANPSFQAPGASSITFTGDVGFPFTTSSVSFITGLFANVGGSTFSFSGDGTSTMTLTITDINNNIMLGLGSGNSNLISLGINNNIGIGYFAFNALNTLSVGNIGIGVNTLYLLQEGQTNTGVGYGALLNLVNGNSNCAIGHCVSPTPGVGSAYTGSESSNILICNSGVNGESNVMRLGTQGSSDGQVDTAFMAGIIGNTITSGVPVYIDPTTGQLGNASTTPIVQGVTITGDAGTAINGTSLTFTTGLSSNANGSTFEFSGDGSTTETLSLTDVNNNICLGNNAGNAAITSLACVNNSAIGAYALNSINEYSVGNMAFGDSALRSYLSGNNNCVFSYGGLYNLTTGQNNTVLGTIGDIANWCGFNYTSSESNNILLCNLGVTGESNVMRLGTTGSSSGKVNQCFIAGVSGVSVAGQPVYCDYNGKFGTISTLDVPVYFSSYLSGDLSNVTGDGTFYNIICDDSFSTFDPSVNYDTGTGLFTAPKTGLYEFNCSAHLYVTNATNTYGYFQLIISGDISTSFVYRNAVGNVFVEGDTANGAITVLNARIVPMTAGDIAQMQISIAGSSKTVGLGGFDGVHIRTAFSGTLLN